MMQPISSLVKPFLGCFFFLAISASLLGLASCATHSPVITDLSEEVSTIRSEEEKPKGHPKYPDERDWPAKWDQWHRYAEVVTCNINDQGGKTCSYLLCVEDMPANEMAPFLRGTSSRGRDINRYYETRCGMVKKDPSLTEISKYQALPRMTEPVPE